MDPKARYGILIGLLAKCKSAVVVGSGSFFMLSCPTLLKSQQSSFMNIKYFMEQGQLDFFHKKWALIPVKLTIPALNIF